MGSTASKKISRPRHLIEVYQAGTKILCSDVSEDFSLLVTGDGNGILRLWSPLSATVECLSELKSHGGSVTCCRIYGDHVISGSSDGTVVKWSIAQAEVDSVYIGHTMKVNSLTCAGKFLLSSSYDRTVRVWHLNQLERQVQGNESPMPIDKGKCTNIDPSACVHILQGHFKSVYPIVFIPADNDWTLARQLCDRDIIVSGSADCQARIWSLVTGDCLKVLEGHRAPVYAIAVNPNNILQIFTGSGDGTIISWDTVTGDKLRTLIGHEGTILSMMTCNKMLYSSSSDKTARAWVMEFAEETRVYKGSQSAVACVHFFDGIHLCYRLPFFPFPPLQVYTASEDGSVRAYDAKSGTIKRLFLGHSESITSIQVVPQRLITTSFDGKMSVWDTKGFSDDTVFGDKSEKHEEASDDDCDNVKRAVRMLDNYIRD
ncbi:WD repeat-containing protein 86 [Halotydeus destructor]|nr:WD repeat-containing protein 86 [Halotydeus destructor]